MQCRKRAGARGGDPQDVRGRDAKSKGYKREEVKKINIKFRESNGLREESGEKNS